MKPLPMLDMLKATQLTRAGRLLEATSLLRGLLRGSEPDAPTDRATPESAGTLGQEHIIDMVPPSEGEEAWTPPGSEAGLSTRRSAADATRQGSLPNGDRSAATDIPLVHSRRVNGPRSGVTAIGEAAPAKIGMRGCFGEHLYSDASGQRTYKLYVPGGYDGQPLPLIVMLHGCTQSPDDFAAGTSMNILAEEQKFLVAYPAQARSANPSGCWNWFSVADQKRDSGEPALIAGITRQIMRDHAVDPARIYIAGLSAGGAATAIMGVTYPDLYAAIGVHSGLPCGSASDLMSALSAMRKGAASGSPGHITPERTVPTIVFHGDRDNTVSPVNAGQVITQFSGTAGPLQAHVTRGTASGGLSFTRKVQSDGDGKALFEHWTVHGAGHAWSGGSSHGSYTDPRGPDASREMLRFFKEHSRA